MQSVDVLKTVFHYTQFAGAGISLLLNTILIILIVTRSPKSLGMYKYLMIYISVFEALYSILDVISTPSVVSYRAAFIVFRDFKHSVFGRTESFLLIVIYCGCFGFSMAIFAVHFIYRYSTVDVVFRKRFLSGRKVYMLFLLPILYGTCWGAVTGFFCRFSDRTNTYLRNGLLDTYDIRAEDLSYAIVLFYLPNEHNQVEADLSAFASISCLWVMIISSVSCVIGFGVKCYQKLSRALATTDMSSTFAKSLQQQLFQALVCQTMIPVILMYIPIAVLFSFPMINVDVGFASSFVVATIALYPATDPLPTMFIIKSYRRTILCRACGSSTKQLSAAAQSS